MKHPVTLLNDPIHEGLIASYAHPGGNVTGIDAHRGRERVVISFTALRLNSRANLRDSITYLRFHHDT